MNYLAHEIRSVLVCGQPCTGMVKFVRARIDASVVEIQLMNRENRPIQFEDGGYASIHLPHGTLCVELMRESERAPRRMGYVDVPRSVLESPSMLSAVLMNTNVLSAEKRVVNGKEVVRYLLADHPALPLVMFPAMAPQVHDWPGAVK